jgi:hypothetical protein
VRAACPRNNRKKPAAVRTVGLILPMPRNNMILLIKPQPTRSLGELRVPPTSWKILGAACAAASVSLLVQAAASNNLNIKLGLWEVTSKGQASGTSPISEEMLAGMSPERRAKFEAAMKASIAKPRQPRVFKECMTAEKLARGFQTGDAEDASCKKTVVSSSASEITLRSECRKPNGTRTVNAHFQAMSTERITGTVNTVTSLGARSMTVNNAIQGKWLGASCGDLKDAGRATK